MGIVRKLIDADMIALKQCRRVHAGPAQETSGGIEHGNFGVAEDIKGDGIEYGDGGNWDGFEDSVAIAAGVGGGVWRWCCAEGSPASTCGGVATTVIRAMVATGILPAMHDPR